jgi:uncharacterized sulfatase
MARDPEQYPMKRIMETAELASALQPEALPRLKEALHDSDSAVRYWAAAGIQMRGEIAVQSARRTLHRALTDDAPSVRVVAAEALAQYGNAQDLQPALQTLVDAANLKHTSVYVAVQALNAIDKLDEKAAGQLDAIKALPKDDPSLHGRVNGYVPRLLDKILADLEG